MATETQETTRVDLSPELKSALVEHLKNLVNAQGYINIAPLFGEPSSLDEFAQTLASCLHEIDTIDPFDKIVLSRLVEPRVGLLPIGGSISVKLNKPLVIYTEASGLLRTEPYIGARKLEGTAAFLDHNPKDNMSAINIVGDLLKEGFDRVVYIALINGNNGIENDLKVVADMCGRTVSFHNLATKDDLGLTSQS